jgi:hypothetical protein
VIGVARRHRRGPDLRGLLVELDPHNVATAAGAIARAGLDGLTVAEGDAGRSDAYTGAVPADLLVACGIFGNVSHEDIRRTIAFLPSLCAPGAWVFWTRAPQPPEILTAIQGWFAEAGFRPHALISPEGGLFGVGAARLAVPPPRFRPGQHLFTFSH